MLYVLLSDLRVAGEERLNSCGRNIGRAAQLLQKGDVVIVAMIDVEICVHQSIQTLLKVGFIANIAE